MCSEFSEVKRGNDIGRNCVSGKSSVAMDVSLIRMKRQICGVVILVWISLGYPEGPPIVLTDR